MIDLIANISKRRVLFQFIAIGFLIFESIFMFPIRYSSMGLFNVSILLFCILIGVILGATFRRSWVKVSLITFMSCLVGLGLRIWLEWGEYTLDKELTVFNVLATYVPVIVVVLISYHSTINSKQYMKALLIETEISRH